MTGRSVNLHVRKQTMQSGKPRYRFSVGRVDFSFKDLSEFNTLRLDFSEKMSEHDKACAIEKLNKKFENTKTIIV